MFRSLFRGREDVFARRWYSKATNKGGYQPVCVNEWRRGEMCIRDRYGKFNRPNLFYPIYVNPNQIDKNGYCKVSLERSLEYPIEVLPLNSEGEESCWRWGKPKFLKNVGESSMESNVVARQKTTLSLIHI